MMAAASKRALRRTIDAAAQPKRLELKASGYVTASDAAQGIVEAIVNVFGIVDLGYDVIVNGSYTKTLNERGNKVRVKVLDAHNTSSIFNVLGKPLEIREVGRDELARLAPDVIADHPDATGGLFTRTQYNLATEKGREAFALIASGDVNEYSIALDVLDSHQERKVVNGERVLVRLITQLRLWEYSPVVFGMNQATVTTDVKAQPDADKTVSGAANLPLADQSRAWDGAAAEGRVRAWAGGEDDLNWSDYRKAFFWYDGDAPENFTSYKLGFADVIDGALTAIPRGLFAVAAVLQGGRGGVDIPEADQEAIKTKVAAYYHKLDLEAPWEKAVDMSHNPTSKASEKARTCGSMMEANLRLQATYCITDWLREGTIDSEAVVEWNAAIDAGMTAMRAALPDDMAMMPMPEPAMWWGLDDSGRRVKAGRMISGSNRAKIQAALDAMQTAMDTMQEMMDASAPADQQDSTDKSLRQNTAVTGSGGSDNQPTPSIPSREKVALDKDAIDRELSEIQALMARA